MDSTQGETHELEPDEFHGVGDLQYNSGRRYFLHIQSLSVVFYNSFVTMILLCTMGVVMLTEHSTWYSWGRNVNSDVAFGVLD